MEDQNLHETSRIQQSSRLQAREKTKRSNWLLSIVAVAGMLAVSLFVFDWYLFSVVDGLLATLQPIAGALNKARGDMQSRPSPRSLDPLRSRDQGVSFIVPAHSLANPKTPAK